jgi:hypothetical protein
MRGGGILGVLVLVWLLLGVYAAYDRGYFTNTENSCGSAATIALNVIAGPLNWVGDINPKTDCNVPDVKIPPPNK